ncbi:MAG: DUF4845 domain-containing protein [Zoogloeaceae bacterium]|jgi:hypothetical protein|nr:DUF4845 domain-containing protein [Zoogloeaceae bacterium]
MKKQRGVSASIVLFWCVIAIIAMWLLAATVPSFLEYRNIMNIVRNITANSQGNATTPTAVRQAFERQAMVDDIQSVKAADLQISNDGGRVVISYEYEKKVKLFGNVSLLIEYKVDSRT